MAKKGVVQEALEGAKSVAGSALAAAASAATDVVLSRVAGAISDGGKKLEGSAPQIQKVAADTVSKPLLPARQKRAAAKRSAVKAKKKVAKKKAVKKKTAKKAVRKKR